MVVHLSFDYSTNISIWVGLNGHRNPTVQDVIQTKVWFSVEMGRLNG